MGDMVEKVARALYTEFIPAIERREGSTKKQWDNLDPDEDAIYLACWMQMARAALEACHHEELVEAAKRLDQIIAHEYDVGVGVPRFSLDVMQSWEALRAVLAKVEAR